MGERGNMHGHGRYTWTDGTVFEGLFVRGERTGRGQLAYANGSKHDGMWHSGSTELASSPHLTAVTAGESGRMAGEYAGVPTLLGPSCLCRRRCPTLLPQLEGQQTRCTDRCPNTCT